jgi:hypothetical protein
VDSTGCVQILHLGKLCLDVFHPISESFVVSNGASLSEVQYAERGAGQVIAKISLMQVHRADPHCYVCITTRPNCTAHHLQVRIWAEISFVVGAGDWLHDVIWSATKQNMRFVVSFPHWTAG